MSTSPRSTIRKSLTTTALLVLVACSNVAQAATYTMFRDPACGCCLKWADHIEHGMDAKIVSVDTKEIAKIKTDQGVPLHLRSCHTMLIEGYVIEGHVPASAIERLLRERPKGVKGLAVPGMPLGSPGMEAGGRIQPYQVIAFGNGNPRVFASYPRMDAIMSLTDGD